MQVLLSFLKLGSHWILPRDYTVGTSLGGATREILEGFPGRVLSMRAKEIVFLVYTLVTCIHRLELFHLIELGIT